MKKKKSTPYWTRVIKNALARKNKGLLPFTCEHQKRASDWVTCACGKQDQRIPKQVSFDGTVLRAPKDEKFSRFGVAFSLAVRLQRPKLAESILGKIEEREQEILAAL